MSSVNDRIKQIRDKFCNGDNAEFAEILGVSPQYASNISNAGKHVGTKTLNKILKLFPSVSPIWLKMGEGDMIKQEPVSQNIVVGNSKGVAINSEGANIMVNEPAEEYYNRQKQIELLKEKVKDLERLLEEKERTIQLLMKKS